MLLMHIWETALALTEQWAGSRPWWDWQGLSAAGLPTTRAVELWSALEKEAPRAGEQPSLSHEHPSQSMDTYQPFPNKPHLSINMGWEIHSLCRLGLFWLFVRSITQYCDLKNPAFSPELWLSVAMGRVGSGWGYYITTRAVHDLDAVGCLRDDVTRCSKARQGEGTDAIWPSLSLWQWQWVTRRAPHLILYCLASAYLEHSCTRLVLTASKRVRHSI